MNRCYFHDEKYLDADEGVLKNRIQKLEERLKIPVDYDSKDKQRFLAGYYLPNLNLKDSVFRIIVFLNCNFSGSLDCTGSRFHETQFHSCNFQDELVSFSEIYLKRLSYSFVI
jgi:hypothetical protein